VLTPHDVGYVPYLRNND
jgi:hypothetical protein